jgi:hypothetical protein
LLFLMSLADALPFAFEVARSLRVGLFTAIRHRLQEKLSAGSSALPAVVVLTEGKRRLRAGRSSDRCFLTASVSEPDLVHPGHADVVASGVRLANARGKERPHLKVIRHLGRQTERHEL